MKVLIFITALFILFHFDSFGQNDRILGTWELVRSQEYAKNDGDLELEDDLIEMEFREVWQFEKDSIYTIDYPYFVNNVVKYHASDSLIFLPRYDENFEIIWQTDTLILKQDKYKRKMNQWFLVRIDANETIINESVIYKINRLELQKQWNCEEEKITDHKTCGFDPNMMLDLTLNNSQNFELTGMTINYKMNGINYIFVINRLSGDGLELRHKCNTENCYDYLYYE